MLAFLLVGVWQTGELVAQTATKGEQEKMQEKEKGQGGTVFLHETFDDHDIDSAPEVSALERVEQVTVVDGGGKAGSGKVARFNDSDTEELGAMEYNVGESALSSMYVEFDAINNDAAKGDEKAVVIFGVGPWGSGRDLVVNSKAKRAFGLEIYQQKVLKLRVGAEPVAEMEYDPKAAFNVKIWANDHDTNTLEYKRPDNGEAVKLKADSVVVWVNNSLIGKLEATGCAMHNEITKGDAVIGRVGFSSSSTKEADFLFDNLSVKDPTAKAEAVKPAETK